MTRILLWHGWLLEGSGSNVATARVAEHYRAAGHDVLLLCQEQHPERYPWIDAFGSVDADGPLELTSKPVQSAAGRCVLLRPRIGSMIPVFVLDRYEGFDEVVRFVDLPDEALGAYLRANVHALRAAAAWHGTEIAFTGHAIPGAAIGRRALGSGRYVAKIHGSDLEYAVRTQERYRELAREGLEAARAVVGPTADVLARCAALVPGIEDLERIVAPGVEVTAFRPRPRREALLEAADLLDRDPDTARGRTSSIDGRVERALEARDAPALDALAETYDQSVPEPDAATRLRRLAGTSGPIVGYLGKLIPQKGVELLLQAHRTAEHAAHALVVGFGSYREWLAALATALERGDDAALAWLREVREIPIELEPDPRARAGARDVTFTGRLDHRYAPDALAAMDVMVVPSILPEAFGMVAAEGAAAGALPLVARHSGLGEVGAALETAIGRPGLLTFAPGPGAVAGLGAALDRVLELPAAERDELRREVSDFVGREWTWDRTAAGLLAAAGLDGRAAARLRGSPNGR
jgi:glycosyltransferase involved in cell wall biosynthesis